MFAGTQTEREEKVSLELSEEILQSMEVGMAFKDYVSIFKVMFSHGFSSLGLYLFCLFLMLCGNTGISNVKFNHW